MHRCGWAKSNSMIEYHDKEWGDECHDENALFEKLILEGQQAGLSWAIILNKRDEYRKAFDNFDPFKIQNYTLDDIEKIMKEYNVIKYDKKLLSIVNNSKVYVEKNKEGFTLDKYFWGKVKKPINNSIEKIDDIKSKTELSEEISKELKKMGFKYVGPVSVYSMMQAMGMVNDHENTCFKK